MSHRALLTGFAMVTLALPAAAAPAGSASQSGMAPFNPNSTQVRSELQTVQTDTVELFDPVARAKALAAELPRAWRGSYLAFGSGAPLIVQLQIASLEAVGQMVVLKGSMTLGSVTTPVQGNLNAKSDQLDLLILGDTSAVGLEPGGSFMGLQVFQLSSWQAPRLTSPGGKLELSATGSRI